MKVMFEKNGLKNFNQNEIRKIEKLPQNIKINKELSKSEVEKRLSILKSVISLQNSEAVCIKKSTKSNKGILVYNKDGVFYSLIEDFLESQKRKIENVNTDISYSVKTA